VIATNPALDGNAHDSPRSMIPSRDPSPMVSTRGDGCNLLWLCLLIASKCDSCRGCFASHGVDNRRMAVLMTAGI
jgi:hypothetical protein